jgi:hypothetical protein
VRLVKVRTIIIIVSLIALFLLDALSLSVPFFDPTACISVTDDVTQVVVVPTILSTALLQWSDSTSRVPTGTLLVVRLMTLVSILMTVDWIHHGCCVQHHLQELDMRADFFIIFG